MKSQPRTEFAQALRAVATERDLDPGVIIASIKEAIDAAYKRDARDRGEEVEELVLRVEIDPITGETKLFDAKGKDITPPGFGRIAAQTAKQVIHQKIREAEKGVIMGEYEERVGTLVSGTVLRFDGPNVRVDLGKTEGLMLASDRVPSEKLSSGQRLTFLLREIEDTPRGKQILLSRASTDFVKKLFEREVPEISSKSVEIKAIAREPGVRTKIAVYSETSGVDPVGSCVGQKGVRVQAVTNELSGERVDIIPWSENDEEMIKAALSPVEPIEVKLDKKKESAKVKVPEDGLSQAIGKDGQNVRVASKLTGWMIEVEGVAIPGIEKKEDTTEDKQE